MNYEAEVLAIREQNMRLKVRNNELEDRVRDLERIIANFNRNGKTPFDPCFKSSGAAMTGYPHEIV